MPSSAPLRRPSLTPSLIYLLPSGSGQDLATNFSLRLLTAARAPPFPAAVAAAAEPRAAPHQRRARPLNGPPRGGPVTSRSATAPERAAGEEGGGRADAPRPRPRISRLRSSAGRALSALRSGAVRVRGGRSRGSRWRRAGSRSWLTRGTASRSWTPTPPSWSWTRVRPGAGAARGWGVGLGPAGAAVAVSVVVLCVGLRSGKLGEQCEAVVRFPRLFQKYPFPILINSAFLKLADVFRVG